MALAVCGFWMIKRECEEGKRGEQVAVAAVAVGLREETARRGREERKEGAGVPALRRAGMPLSYHRRSKKIGVMRLPGFAGSRQWVPLGRILSYS